MRGLRRRFGRSMRGELTFAEEYIHDHGEIAGAALVAGLGALIGGDFSAAAAGAGGVIGAVGGAAAGLALRRKRRAGAR